MMKITSILALGFAAFLAAAGIAHAQGSHHLQIAPTASPVLSSDEFEPRVLLIDDRPNLDGVIRSLESRYGPGQLKSVSDVFVGRDGREYYTVKYLTEDGQMIIVRVDAGSGQIVGGR